jgi:predicted DNA-binding transcriptional regulator AlpA
MNAIEQSEKAEPDSLLPFLVVSARVGGLSRSTLWRRVKGGDFPQPLRVGRRVMWRARDVADYIEAQRAL